jgi:hypothetical protein
VWENRDTLALVASLFLAQASSAAPTGVVAELPPRVLVLETRADAAHENDVKAFGDLLATLLERRSTAVIVPASSVKDRLAVAADKMTAGCDDNTCLTELAGALDARFVVSERASQVGGRWLMRVELFDSRDLKVVAQTSVMSDGVEGLAAQAEALADDLMARAPMLPRRGETNVPVDASLGDTSSSSSSSSSGPGSLPWIVAGSSVAAAVAATGLATSSLQPSRSSSPWGLPVESSCVGGVCTCQSEQFSCDEPHVFDPTACVCSSN